MKPLASALHVLEPLSSGSGNQQSPQRNGVRAFELSINDFVTVTIATGPGASNSIAKFTTGTGHGPGTISMQGYIYHVNWQPEREEVGKSYSIVFAVAGLRLNALPYAAANRRELPIRFFIESHPRIRARVMHAQGYGASDIARQLMAEYQSPGQDVAQILFDEQFPALEIGQALFSVYAATAQQAADWLHAAGMGAADMARVLAGVYQLGAVDSARVLRLASYDISQVYVALKEVFQLVRDEAEDVLVAAGFSAEDAFKAVLPDLLTWYDSIISQYGPTVYMHPSEGFKMAGIDWFLDRVNLQYEAAGQTYTYQDPSNHVSTANLATIVEGLKAAGATNFWLGSTGQFTDALKAGDPGSARARVHVVRLRDTGYTDFQFWLWYPYNGPGTMHVRATIQTFYDSTVWEVGQNPDDYGNAHPLGEHYSDWENIVLRTDTKTGRLIGAFMSEHGDYVPYFVSTNGLAQDSAGHVVAYASLNGHANYPTAGDNGNVVKQSGVDQLKGFFSFDLFAELRNYTAASSAFLTASTNYTIDGVDQYFLDGSRQVSSNSWIAFDGNWGPVHPLNLTDSEKLAIVKTIAGDAITKVRLDIPKLAAEGCSVVAAPCAAIFGVGYAGCFAGCMAGLVVGAEAAIDPLVNKYGPGIVDQFPKDDQALDGKPSPGLKRRGTEWQYLRFPNEQPALVRVAALPEQVAGTVSIMVNVANDITAPAGNSYGVTVSNAALSINGNYVDLTGSPVSGGYVYSWDTATVPDGTYELHARLTGTDGKFYEYSWDRSTVEVANHSLIFDPLLLSDKRIIEGGSVDLHGHFYTSQTNQNSSVTLNWGDGSGEAISLAPGIRDFTRSHTYVQDSPADYTIMATLSDGTTNVTRSVVVQVANASPVITSLASGQDLAPLAPSSASANFSAAFSDPGTLDTHSVTWTWGDGTSNTVAGVQSPLGEIHVYNNPGVYGASLAVTDSANATAQSNLSHYITIYNPAGAYFAGSGSIIAPVPTSGTNQVLVQAPFGFVLQPVDGVFSLRFKLGDTEFFSTHYDRWQTNSAHDGGRIVGTGTLNGSNYTNGLPYQFVVNASVSSFQLQIATPVTNSVPYQTQANQPLSTGRILFR